MADLPPALSPEEFKKKLNEMVASQIAHDKGDGHRIAKLVEALASELGMSVSVIAGGIEKQIEEISENTKKYMMSEAKKFAPKAFLARMALHELKSMKDKREKMN